MVAERVGRPVRPLIHAQGPWGGPGAMSVPSQQPDDGFMTSGVSPGNVIIKEEEYRRLVQAAALATAQPQGAGSSEPILGGSSDAPIRVGEESPSMPTMRSASESGSPVTRRELSRTKRRLVHVSEHLREKLKQTKQALDEEAQRRQLEALTLRKLLEDRMDMLTSAFHSAIGALREDLNSLMPLKEKVEDLKGATTLRCQQCARGGRPH